MAGACCGLIAKEDEGRLDKDSFDVGWSNELCVKLVTKKRAQQSTRSAIVQYGKGSEGRSQSLSESGSKKRGLQRKNGTGKEVCIVAHSLTEKPMEQRAFQDEAVGVREAQELGFASRGLEGPCCHGRLLAGKSGQVESMWLGSGAVWIMMRS